MKRSSTDTLSNLSGRREAGRAWAVTRLDGQARAEAPTAQAPSKTPGPLSQFRVDESVRDGLARISGTLIQRALIRIARAGKSRAEDLHQVRLAVKRVRASLRLVRPVIGKAFFRQENRRLKKVANRLSLFRDATVARHTLERLARGISSRHDKKAFALVSRGLTERTLGPGRLREQREAAMGEVAPELLEAGDNLQSMLIPTEEWGAIGPGLHDVYRRARNGMSLAIKLGTDEAFHEWRKQVKHLYYQLQMLQPTSPRRIGALVKQLKKLEESLGRDHDLSVLGAVLKELAERCCGRRAIKCVVACLERQRNKLRRESDTLGRKFFWEKPVKFAAKLNKYWAAWHCPGEF